MLELADYLILSAIIFSIGLVGIFIHRHNVIILLMCVELMLLGANTNFIAFSHFLDDVTGQVFVFFVMTVAAAEVVVGLSIIVLLFRAKSSVKLKEVNSLNN